MDHSYGIMQDSGMGIPSQEPRQDGSYCKGRPADVIIRSKVKTDGVCDLVLSVDLDHTEEVETTLEDSGLGGDSRHHVTTDSSVVLDGIVDVHQQLSSPGKLQGRDRRGSTASQHDSGLADLSSLTPTCSTSSSLHSLSSRRHLASPMEVFIPNATSTPEEGSACKMEVQSPSHVVKHSNISDLHRSLLMSGIKHHSPDSLMSISPDEAVAPVDRRPTTPLYDSAFDMSHMAVPGDGYFSRENLRSVQIGRVSRNLESSHMRQAKRRIGLHNMESTPPAQANPFINYPRERTPSPNNADMPRLNLNDMDQEPSKTPDNRRPVNILKTEPVGAPDGEKMIIQIPALKPRTHSLPARGQLADLRRQLHQHSAPAKAMFQQHAASSAFSSLAQMQAVLQKGSNTPKLPIPRSRIPEGQQAMKSGFDPGPKDDSLTNIHWLKNMSSAGFVPNTSPLVPVVKDTVGSTPILINGNHIIIQQQQEENSMQEVSVVDSEKHIKKIAEECGRSQRPPYAYMHLIQMAIKSYPDQRATLKQIYSWIEDTFPYYKYTDKKGWKNSIRHNLSLYNIFVRKRSGIPGSTGCSYWTLQPGIKPMPKSRLQSASFDSTEKVHTGNRNIQPAINGFQTSANSAFTCLSNNNIQKKGQATLLPKPPPVQSYTIIPLPAEGSLSPSVLGSHAIVVTSDQVNMATNDGSLDSETIQAVNSLISSCSSSQASQEQTASTKVSSLKRSKSCEMTDGPRKKQVKTGPMPSILTRRRPSSHCASNNAFLTNSLDTSDLMHQMSQMKFETSANDSSRVEPSQDSQDGFDYQSSQNSQPRARKPRKEKIKYRVDSSERKEEEDCRITKSKMKKTNKLDGAYISAMSEEQLQRAMKIEEHLTSPLRGLLMTPPRDVMTSTPSKESSNSPDSWISPIHGLPTFNDDHQLLDISSLLEITPNTKSFAHEKHSPVNLNTSPGLGSLREFGLPGLTPLKPRQYSRNEPCSPLGGEHSPNSSFNLCNQSFSRLLGDIHLDSVMTDDFTNSEYVDLSFSHLP